jgi:dephospho-CoA kinase
VTTGVKNSVTAKVICLTGGIASGKSSAARFLKEQGAHVIDADILGHQVYDPGMPAHAQVVAAFGNEVLAADGKIDRKVLGGKVFGKPAELKKLTDIVWPAIGAMAEAEIARARGAGTARVIVLEAAVLFEAGWHDRGDETWVVVVDRETAIARAMQRDHSTRAMVESRLDAQLSNAERVARANVVIDNNGVMEEMLAQLRRHWQRLNSAAFPGNGNAA